METIIARVKEHIAKSAWLPLKMCLNSCFWKPFFSVCKAPSLFPRFLQWEKSNWTHISIILLSDWCAPFFRTDKNQRLHWVDTKVRAIMLCSKLSKEGTRLLYPALGQDWHCDVQPSAAGSLTGNPETAKPSRGGCQGKQSPRWWLRCRAPSAFLQTGIHLLIPLAKRRDQSQRAAPSEALRNDWEQSSREILELLQQQIQKSKSFYYISFSLLEKHISYGVWASLISFQFSPSTQL